MNRYQYKRFMFDSKNIHNCSECPENEGYAAWPETKLPCGQFCCWIEIYTADPIDEEYDTQHFTPEEIAESDLEAELIMALIDARESQGVSQRSLEGMSGIKQPAIARIEKGVNSPTVETLIRLLAPLGKKLAVVPMNPSANV